MTSAGRIAADAVVVALGSFTAPLLAKLGIRVPIYPVKGVSITFPRGAWNSAPRMPVIDDSKLFGLVPIGDRMRISGSAEITGYDATPAHAAGGSHHRECQLHLSRAAAPPRPREGAHLGGPQAGQPCRHADHGAGRDSRDCAINAGHGHLGWTLACGSGRVVADMVSGKKPEIGLPGRRVSPCRSAA